MPPMRHSAGLLAACCLALLAGRTSVSEASDAGQSVAAKLRIVRESVSAFGEQSAREQPPRLAQMWGNWRNCFSGYWRNC